ncbi:2,5-didehydrogluconate reductase [Coprinopsis cinerea okayama7|uniref:2,5-didehydrogluconate reductase n=1 Tax=Coprinopsis cinerea (strain Okayama-7 / 130 / ATCC MYA-4618 / FGSC 9003) TaxID=240176 RepID=A8N741_COPC7|nr:2,5-didehydrogluconate reductase [Coprinopsis cinerea okayama7\|eukprot:XP_001830647.2 2,5-didehydrogluconate reductase [Coprinopsis cinerea okayama7\
MVPQSHIDSAQAYRNEAHVAEAVRESGIDRNEVFITTKVISKFHGYDRTVKAIEASLDSMKFDYIDLFLIHDPHAGKVKRLETYKALLEAKAAGKIRSVGVSNYGIHHLEEIVEAGLETPSVNQIEQRPIVEYCKKHDIVVQAYSPLIRSDLGHPVFKELAAKYGNRDPAQIVLRWSLQKGFVPLPKSANPDRIKSNTLLYDFALSDEDMAKLDALDKGKEGAVTWNCVDVP